MHMSTIKRIIILIAVIFVISIAGSVILNFVFHVENPWPWMAFASLLAVPPLYIKLFQLPYVKWKNAYNVGVEEIDYDHKQLVGLINQVVTASHYNLGDRFVHEILDKLIDYTKYHLDREEKLMEQYGYPGRVGHIAQHVKFIGKIDKFYSKFTEDRKMKSEAVFEFLRDWLLKHISNTDKDLGEFISAKRASEANAKTQ